MRRRTTNGRSGSRQATGWGRRSSTRRRSIRIFSPSSTAFWATAWRSSASCRQRSAPARACCWPRRASRSSDAVAPSPEYCSRSTRRRSFFDGLLEKTALTTFFTCALLYVMAERRLTFREFLAGGILGLLVADTRKRDPARDTCLSVVRHRRAPASAHALRRRLSAAARSCCCRWLCATTRSVESFT